MKIVSWNVNSVFCRYSQILYLIEQENPDLIFLQETKTKVMPFFENYYCYSSDSIKGRNGVAILSKEPLEKIEEIPERLIMCKNSKFHFFSVYVPNGGSPSASIEHKLKFLKDLKNLVKQNSIIGGDFNVLYKSSESTMPTEIYSDIEKDALMEFEDNLLNTTDTTKQYITWWDYRMNRFKENIGLGLDKFYLSENISYEKYVMVLKNYRSFVQPSDHAPIIIKIQE